MPKRSSIAMFLAATSLLAITTSEPNTVKDGEKDLKKTANKSGFKKIKNTYKGVFYL